MGLVFLYLFLFATMGLAEELPEVDGPEVELEDPETLEPNSAPAVPAAALPAPVTAPVSPAVIPQAPTPENPSGLTGSTMEQVHPDGSITKVSSFKGSLPPGYTPQSFFGGFPGFNPGYGYGYPPQQNYWAPPHYGYGGYPPRQPLVQQPQPVPIQTPQ